MQCKLLSAGSNARGQLASGHLEDAYTFSPCSFLDYPLGTMPSNFRNIVQIACGSNHTLLLLERTNESSSETYRELWGCGDGSRGQLGPAYTSQGLTASLFRPLDLELHRHGLANYTLKGIAACWETSYVVLSFPRADDVLVSFGANDFGDLGIGDSKVEQGQVNIVDFHSAVSTYDPRPHSLTINSVSAGTHHVVAHLSITLQDDTSRSLLVGWGTCRQGQLGPMEVLAKPRSFLSSPSVMDLSSSPPIVLAALGAQHTILLRSSGQLLGLGSDKKGQIQGIDLLQDIVALGCTWNSTYAVLERSGEWSISSTGSNTHGQLGRRIVSPEQDQGHPLSIVEFPFTCASRKLIKITCGSEHVLCLFSLRDKTAVDASADSGVSPRTEVWGWGWNEHGNLGTASTEDAPLPTKIWPPVTFGLYERMRAVYIWAGCGTSWIALEVAH